MADALQYLWPAIEAVDPVFSRAALIRWPNEARIQLVSAQLIVPQGTTTRIRCPECGQTHVATPVPRKQHDGTVRFFIPCSLHLRAEVTDRDIQQWAANVEGLAHTLSAALSLGGRSAQLASDRVWRCGRWTYQEVLRDVLFARGLRRKDAAQFRRAISAAHRPIVFVGAEVPDPEFWQGRVPPLIRLREVATLANGKLDIDVLQVVGLVRAADERHDALNIRESEKQQATIRRAVKEEIKALVPDDNLVAAYKEYGSYNKAVAGLAKQGYETNRSAVERAVQRAGGIKTVMRGDDSESVVRTVSSRRRDTPIKNRDSHK